MKSVNILYLCLAAATIALGSDGTETSNDSTYVRLTDYFVIGEKSIRPVVKKDSVIQGIKKIDNFGDINAFSIIDVKLRQNDAAKGENIIASLRKKEWNILLVADLKKKGETEWNRISTINKYTREVQKSSQCTDTTSSMESEARNSSSMKPFYVKDVILRDNPYIKEGDRIQALFFFDISECTVYLRDLIDTQREDKSLMSIDAQEMYLVTVGSAPQKYSAKDGDTIRLRLLRSEYSIRRLDSIKHYIRNDEPIPELYKYADIVNVEDEMTFVFKEYGTKVDISPIISYASRVGENFDSEDFNPISKNPSLGSNVYLSYDGRDSLKQFINYLPGLHFSLLGLKGDEEVEFTAGFVWSLPGLREWLGVFVGWHNLKDLVVGLTFAPTIKFRKLVQAEESE